MASLLPCLPCGRPERLAADAEVLLACDLAVTSSRRPKSGGQPRHVWLLADALALFDREPARGSAAAPTEVIRLQQVSSLQGRQQGSDCIRLGDTTGLWWELRATEPGGELPLKLATALGERVDKFRKFRKSVAPGAPRRTTMRTSSLRSSSKREALKDRRLTLRNAAKSKDSADPAARKMGLLKRLALSLPCSPGSDFADKVGGERTPVRGASFSESGNANALQLSRQSHPDLDESESVLWTHEGIKFLLGAQEVPQDLASDLTHTVRRGVPDGLKRILWPLGAGVAGTFVEGRCASAHERLLNRAFGDVMPERFDAAVPLFSQGIEGVDGGAPELADVIPHLALLSEAGRTALRRSLWCITLVHSRVEYCPMLPNLLAGLLVFFEESEAMVIVDHVVHTALTDTSESSNPPLVLNADMLNRQAKLLLSEAKQPHGAPEAVAHLEQLGADVPALLIRLLQDGLAAALPFRALCRLYGAFLFEGSVAVLHYALAVLKLTAPEVLKSQTSEGAFAALRGLRTSLGSSPESLDRLTKLAFTATLGGAFRKRVSATLATKFVARKQDLSHVFCRPRLFEPRGACPDDLWQAIWPWVPEFCRVFDPRLVYTPGTDGRLVRTIFAKCKEHSDAPMIFFVYSAAGDIVGGFSPIPWTRSSSYVDCKSLRSSASHGHSFVFRKLAKGGGQKPEVFPWSGRNEQLMVASEQLGLGFGGSGIAISVDSDIVRAQTSACDTFNCPSLMPLEEGKDGAASFDIARLEVFVLS